MTWDEVESLVAFAEAWGDACPYRVLPLVMGQEAWWVLLVGKASGVGTTVQDIREHVRQASERGAADPDLQAFLAAFLKEQARRTRLTG